VAKMKNLSIQTQHRIIRAEYIWIDGTEPTALLRSKTRTFAVGLKSGYADVTLALFPEWGFDGSSTNQANGVDSDCGLNPVAFCYNPAVQYGAGNSFLVLCEVMNPDGTPHETNHRAGLQKLMETKVGEGTLEERYRPQIGFEQEYTMFSHQRPLGWPIDPHGKRAMPPPQGPYYCGVGADEAYGRALAERHLEMCMMAGLSVCGINAEVMPGQWEFQIGHRNDELAADPLSASDELILARWLLFRLSEDYNITVTLDCKPMGGDWNGAGCHTNFSISDTRNEENGMESILAAMPKLEAAHKQHIAVYGYGNERRLTGKHETCPINEFRYGIADRGASVRIPRHVAVKGCGYLEDRRPGANIDPYIVSSRLIRTVCF